MFRTYDDWKAHNPADEEWDDLSDENIDELQEERYAQHRRWALESLRYCPVQQFDDDDLPF